ncbi:hypothetical protein [Ralstonia solanacearum]|uniref:hypothetical protein n=1 Tax=Ralstonia solanacearum TaxID=305 RepID=UPI00202AA1D7|nr:hypothetical protein [Ralstonia solanacearum]MCL9846571.1 hypothetical protein [Ralstonia solanacearum]MDC6255431.1 hypothetical protein [Ralstonia solanacearum]MDC6259874.1 hypothetical protein [Ralstonia solanacearum]MDC6304621.1 hypothetical protein [Ralstonia solanacearum]
MQRVAGSQAMVRTGQQNRSTNLDPYQGNADLVPTARGSTQTSRPFRLALTHRSGEKNPGPHWGGAVVRALGYADARVPRATIDRELLRKPFAQAA